MPGIKVIGSMLIVTGTAIGAGMLALPLVSGGAGFTFSVVVLIAIWALMTYTGLLVLEVCLALKPYHNSFSSMARKTLGRGGAVVAWFTCLLLLYALTCAYISGASSLLTTLFDKVFHWHMPDWLNAILFTLVFGGIVYTGTRATDILNRALISAKGLFLLVGLVLLFPDIHAANLMSSPHHAKYLWIIAPIFLTSFGYHTVIPSLVNYLGGDKKGLRIAILGGATIPVVIYLLWMLVTLGLIPYSGHDSFLQIAHQHGSVGVFVQFVYELAHNRYVTFSINAFTNIAITTSFLGVTLGLFDFLADGFKRPNTRWGRTQTAALTYVIPLVLALVYPKCFVLALGYAAIFVAILLVIMPALMAYQLRRSKTLSSTYQVAGGSALLWLVMLAGVVLIGIQVASSLHLLPVLS